MRAANASLSDEASHDSFAEVFGERRGAASAAIDERDLRALAPIEAAWQLVAETELLLQAGLPGHELPDGTPGHLGSYIELQGRGLAAVYDDVKEALSQIFEDVAERSGDHTLEPLAAFEAFQVAAIALLAREHISATQFARLTRAVHAHLLPSSKLFAALPTAAAPERGSELQERARLARSWRQSLLSTLAAAGPEGMATAALLAAGDVPEDELDAVLGYCRRYGLVDAVEGFYLPGDIPYRPTPNGLRELRGER